MRSLLFELRPGETTIDKGIPITLTGSERIRHYGILGALRLLAEDFSHDGIKVRVEISGSGSKLFEAETAGKVGNEAALKEGVYRIIQESLNNAIKHSRARHVTVRIKNTPPASLCFSVTDDGIGFHPKSPDTVESAQGSGLGMKIMRERAEAMGGSLSVISSPGQGTIIEVIVPLKESNI
jgi:signal transduction histidine kinase